LEQVFKLIVVLEVVEYMFFVLQLIMVLPVMMKIYNSRVMVIEGLKEHIPSQLLILITHHLRKIVSILEKGFLRVSLNYNNNNG